MNEKTVAVCMGTSSDHGPCSDPTCESTAVTLEWDKMCYVLCGRL